MNRLQIFNFEQNEIRTIVIDDENSRMSTKWTQKGRLFIYETLKNHGYLPLIER